MSNNGNSTRVIAAIFTLLMTLGACARINNIEIPELLKPVNAPADIVEVRRGDVRQLAIYEGTVVAYSEPLHFEASSAPLGEVLVSPGDSVTEGDVLARLDTSGLDATVEFLTQSLEFNEALWRNTNAQSEAAIARAKSAGMTDLVKSLENALAYERSGQALERQRVNDKLERIEASRADYEIVAPFSGMIAHVEQLPIGAFIAPRSTFIWLSDLASITVQSNDAQAKSDVSYSSRVTADFGSGEVDTVRLTYTQSENMVFRQQNITPPVRFAPKEGSAFPVDRRILLRVYGQTRSGVLTLLPNAVHDDTIEVDGTPRHSYFVYLDENGSRVRRDIEVGLKSETSVEIVSGLEEGDKVYVEEN